MPVAGHDRHVCLFWQAVFYALLRGFGKTPILPNCAPAPFRSDFLINFILKFIFLSYCFSWISCVGASCCRTLASCCRQYDRSLIYSVFLMALGFLISLHQVALVSALTALDTDLVPDGGNIPFNRGGVFVPVPPSGMISVKLLK